MTAHFSARLRVLCAATLLMLVAGAPRVHAGLIRVLRTVPDQHGMAVPSSPVEAVHVQRDDHADSRPPRDTVRLRLRNPGAARATALFREAGVLGCFVIREAGTKRTVRVNPSRCALRHSPASTFKIPNALIALETGVVNDERTVFPWDSIPRPISEWNRDHDLASAMRYSVVPYFQDVARGIGTERMGRWIRRFSYGNTDIGGGIDRFWLDGRLTISADEQITFLERLATFALPCSRRSMDIVHRILELDRHETAVLYGKTGWALREGRNVGWFVGWVSQGGKTWVYALNIVPVGERREDFTAQRRRLAERLLRMCGVWDGGEENGK